jgi:F-box interacting protein
VYLNGTINWLALHDNFCASYHLYRDGNSISIEQYVIVSLDLSSETFTQLLLPRGFDKAPHYIPTLVVLRDSLCFCHDIEVAHFVIWQMKDYGVHESWIQLFKIGYNNLFSELEFEYSNLFPLYLSENGDTLVLANVEDNEVIIYNCRDNRVEKIGITNNIMWSQAKGYIESLVSTN